MNVLADVGDGAAERVAAENHGTDPEDPTENVERHIAAIGHARCSCHRWTERSNDRNKACEDHGAAAVLLIEFVRALQMAAAEEERILALVKSSAGGAADPVANLVSDNGAKHDWQEEPAQRDDIGSSKN